MVITGRLRPSYREAVSFFSSKWDLGQELAELAPSGEIPGPLALDREVRFPVEWAIPCCERLRGF